MFALNQTRRLKAHIWHTGDQTTSNDLEPISFLNMKVTSLINKIKFVKIVMNIILYFFVPQN